MFISWIVSDWYRLFILKSPFLSYCNCGFLFFFLKKFCLLIHFETKQKCECHHSNVKEHRIKCWNAFGKDKWQTLMRLSEMNKKLLTKSTFNNQYDGFTCNVKHSSWFSQNGKIILIWRKKKKKRKTFFSFFTHDWIFKNTTCKQQ